MATTDSGLESETGRTRSVVAAFLSVLGECHEKRLQNLLFYAKHNHPKGARILDDVDFRSTIDGPFSEDVRDCLENLVEDGRLTTKTDVHRGNFRTRYVADSDLQVSADALKLAETVHRETKHTETDELVEENAGTLEDGG